MYEKEKVVFYYNTNFNVLASSTASKTINNDASLVSHRYRNLEGREQRLFKICETKRNIKKQCSGKNSKNKIKLPTKVFQIYMFGVDIK